MNEFDQKAKEWDMNPDHVERSRAIADLLLQAIHMDKDMTALEYGAGTGLLSLMLKDHLGKITLMDSSGGMINVIKQKITQKGILNLEPVYFDLEKGMYGDEFDIVFTQLVLHHVKDINAMLHKFSALLKPGGVLAIADLYPEDGSFHDEGFTGHKGFDPLRLSNELSALGFRNINHVTCFVIRKDIGEGNTKDYPVFLITACK
jgi:ubiquinone/menaquinone biosynthesis C-methylase UbiE